MSSEIFTYLSSLEKNEYTNLLDEIATDCRTEHEHFRIIVQSEDRKFDEYGGILVRHLIFESTKSTDILYCCITATYMQNDYLGCLVDFKDKDGNVYTLPSQ